MEKRLLTFEFDTDHVEIHGNESGLRYLIEQLQQLIDCTKANQFDHIHLMTEEWGGHQLTSTLQGKGEIIDQVTIVCWKNV
jgi:hypothetical protein